MNHKNEAQTESASFALEPLINDSQISARGDDNTTLDNLRPAPVKDNRLKAIIFMNFFAIGAAGNSVIFKLAAAQGAEVIDYQVFRNVSVLIISSIELCCIQVSPIEAFPWHLKHQMLWRSLTGQAAFFLFNYCLMLIPLTFQIIVFQTGCFWTSILAWVVFRETLLPLEIIAMVVCFAGMVTITLSGANQAQQDSTAESQMTHYSSQNLILGYSLIFLVSWIYAANCVLNRSLKSVHHAVVMWWHGALGITLALVAMIIDYFVNPQEGGGLRILNYDGDLYGLLTGATLFDSLAVNSVTIAFQSDSSGFLSLISYINILYAFLADILIFDESFSTLELVGALIILIVTVGTSIYKLRESQSAARRLSKADSFTSADDLNRSYCKAE